VNLHPCQEAPQEDRIEFRFFPVGNAERIDIEELDPSDSRHSRIEEA